MVVCDAFQFLKGVAAVELSESKLCDFIQFLVEFFEVVLGEEVFLDEFQLFSVFRFLVSLVGV